MVKAPNRQRSIIIPDDTDDQDLPKGYDTPAAARAYFPRAYATGLFDYIKRHADQIAVLSYKDFPWDDDFNWQADYPAEKAAWIAGLKSGRFDKNKAYVVIQYDVDSRPERTLNLLRHSSHQTLPANIMIFNRRIDRLRLKTSGIVDFTDYDLDDAYLNELEASGNVIGYHSNAYEQSSHNLAVAQQIFVRDITELRLRFPLQFFSAHGGVPGSDGRNNLDLPLPDSMAQDVRWVHNGHSPYFDGQFSDGGHNSPQRDPVGRDLRSFVAGFKPGNRYRILLHPQYYAPVCRASKRFSEAAWYRDVLALARNGEHAAIWSDATIDRIRNCRMQSFASKLINRRSQILIALRHRLSKALRR